MTLDGERDRRLRESMAEHRLDAVLAWRTQEVVVATSAYPHRGVTLCLYPRVGLPVCYSHNLEPKTALPQHMTVRLYHDVDALKKLIAEDLRAYGLQQVDYSDSDGAHALPGNVAEYAPYGSHLIAELLGEAGISGDFFARQLIRKTAYDVEKILLAQRIASMGVQAFREELQAGRTEAELAGVVEMTIQAQTGKHGCGLARGWAFVQGGENVLLAGSTSRSSGYALQSGDMVVLELATVVDGYWSDLTRTEVVGTASPEQTRLIEAVAQAQRAGINAVKAGVSHQEIDSAARNVLNALGMGEGFTHGVGHHTGFRYHDDGPGVMAGSTAPLEAGNVITVEPGVYGAAFGGGCRIEDNVLVTENGYRVLSL